MAGTGRHFFSLRSVFVVASVVAAYFFLPSALFEPSIAQQLAANPQAASKFSSNTPPSARAVTHAASDASLAVEVENDGLLSPKKYPLSPIVAIRGTPYTSRAHPFPSDLGKLSAARTRRVPLYLSAPGRNTITSAGLINIRGRE